jgi:hypothetical protein
MPIVIGFHFTTNKEYMNTIAEIEIREVYGNKAIYPVNNTAKYLAQLAGTKTLTTSTLATAKNMGFTFEVIQPTFKI